jgi:hypothetical protein
MESARLWSGVVVDPSGAQNRVYAESVSTHDDKIAIVFCGVPTMPKHVTLTWNGAQILSLSNARREIEKLDPGTPGRVIWNASERKLHFVANERELREVCASRDGENKFRVDP